MPRRPTIHSGLGRTLPLSILLACHPGERATEPAPDVDRTELAYGREPSLSDAAIARHWAAAGVHPVGRADDAQYLRRVTLDLAGRVPTPDEVRAYTHDSDSDKAEALVDRLLQSEEFAAHWADVYTELLLGGATKIPPAIEQGMHQWLATQLAGDARWDRMTREMITVSGVVTAEGPAGFVAVHARNNRVEAVTGTVARVFLGVSIQCAQCHDHPTDNRYTQRDFYGLAAYFAQTRARIQRGDGQPASVKIVDKRRGQMRLPTPDDAPGLRSGAVVAPSFLGTELSPAAGQSRREALADAIVDSPLFAKAAVGRIWTQLLGRGLVQPWDDLGAADDPRHPPLLDALSAQWVAQAYDLRALLRTIVLSEAYTLTSAGDDDRKRRTDAFAQFPVRPMTTQQLVRSLLVATGRKGDSVAQREATVRRMTRQARKAHLVEFGDDEMLSADAFAGSVPQALFLLGGPLTVRGAQANDNYTLGKILREHTTTPARIDALTLATLGRAATATEHQRFGDYIRAASGSQTDAFEDVLGSVLLSSEFLTVH